MFTNGKNLALLMALSFTSFLSSAPVLAQTTARCDTEKAAITKLYESRLHVIAPPIRRAQKVATQILSSFDEMELSAYQLLREEKITRSEFEAIAGDVFADYLPEYCKDEPINTGSCYAYIFRGYNTLGERVPSGRGNLIFGVAFIWGRDEMFFPRLEYVLKGESREDLLMEIDEQSEAYIQKHVGGTKEVFMAARMSQQCL